MCAVSRRASPRSTPQPPDSGGGGHLDRAGTASAPPNSGRRPRDPEPERGERSVPTRVRTAEKGGRGPRGSRMAREGSGDQGCEPFTLVPTRVRELPRMAGALGITATLRGTTPTPSRRGTGISMHWPTGSPLSGAGPGYSLVALPWGQASSDKVKGEGRPESGDEAGRRCRGVVAETLHPESTAVAWRRSQPPWWGTHPCAV